MQLISSYISTDRSVRLLLYYLKEKIIIYINEFKLTIWISKRGNVELSFRNQPQKAKKHRIIEAAALVFAHLLSGKWHGQCGSR